MTAVLPLALALPSAAVLAWACQVGLSFLLSCTQMLACPSAAALGVRGYVMMDNLAA
jgi:hypothetical protein